MGRRTFEDMITRSFVQIFLIIFFITSSISAQRQVEIMVIDASNKEILPYPSISILGDNPVLLHPYTYFLDSIQANSDIQVTYVGYEDQLIKLSNSTTYTVELLRSSLLESPEMLQTIQVTAYSEGTSLLNQGGAVQVLKVNRFSAFQETNVTESLNRMPGVFVHQGALNTNRITMRGIGSRSPFSTRKIRAYLNDIPLTNGEGETTIEDIDPELLESITVVKGPASSNFGSGLGGTILLKTKKKESYGTDASIGLGVGSYGLVKGKINLFHNKENSQVYLGYHGITSNGYRENNEYFRQSFTSFGKWTIKQKHQLEALGSLITLKAFIPSSLTNTDYNEAPRTAAEAWGKTKGFEDYTKTLAGLTYTIDIRNDFFWKTSLFNTYKSEYEVRPFNILDAQSLLFGGRTTANWLKNINGNHLVTRVGMEYAREKYDWKKFENIGRVGDIGELLDHHTEFKSYYNVFLLFDFTWQDWITFSAGLNLNKTSYKITDRYFDSVEEDQSGQYGYLPAISPRLAVTYKKHKNWSTFLNFSHGFSPPSLEETLEPAGDINPEIKPEKGWNVELGYRGDMLGNRLRLESSIYSMWVKDLLVARRLESDEFVGVNAGKTWLSGFEASATAILLQSSNASEQQLTLFGNYDFSNYYFLNFEDLAANYDGKEVTGVPRHKFVVGAEGGLKMGLYFQSQVLYVASMPIRDDNSVYSKPYALLNGKLGFRQRIAKKIVVDLFVSGRNLTNNKYASMLQINAGNPGSNNRYYYPGLPANYYASLKFTWNLPVVNRK